MTRIRTLTILSVFGALLAVPAFAHGRGGGHGTPIRPAGPGALHSRGVPA